MLNRTEDHSSASIKKLVIKIRSLVNELSQYVSARQMKKMLGTLALFLGISIPMVAQTFAPPITNPFGLDSLPEQSLITSADLDNDGDTDLLFAIYDDGYAYSAIEMHYYENIGTAQSPQFDTVQINPFGLEASGYLVFPEFVDIDGDGDFDLIVGGQAYYGDGIKYYQNIGTPEIPNFKEPQSSPFGLVSSEYINLPTFADLDADGDQDAIFSGYYGGFEYFENVGSATIPSFDIPILNPFGLDSIYQIGIPRLVDLDADGDQDLLVGEYYGAFKFFENVGSAENAIFGKEQTNPFGLDSVHFIASPTLADFDNDGDLDMLVKEIYGAVKYYENTLMTSIGDIEKNSNIQISPNPSAEFISINTDISLKSIEIFDLKGNAILQEVYTNQRIDISSIPDGNYFVHLIDEKDNRIIEKMIKISGEK